MQATARLRFCFMLDALGAPCLISNVGPHFATAMFNRIKALFTKAETSQREFRDAELGVLTVELGLWTGTVARDGITIPFTVAGTQAAPDGGLLDRVRDIVHRFRDVEAEGLAFLRAEVPEVRSSKLAFHGLEFLWEDKPGIYGLEWLAEGDDSRVWRVNYEAGKPKEAGFDD